jgi:hypothetical protein
MGSDFAPPKPPREARERCARREGLGSEARKLPRRSRKSHEGIDAYSSATPYSNSKKRNGLRPGIARSMFANEFGCCV